MPGYLVAELKVRVGVTIHLVGDGSARRIVSNALASHGRPGAPKETVPICGAGEAGVVSSRPQQGGSCGVTRAPPIV